MSERDRPTSFRAWLAEAQSSVEWCASQVRELNRRYERERELDAGTREFVERMVAQMRGERREP